MISYEDGFRIAQKITKSTFIMGHNPVKLEIVGSLRRKVHQIKDIDFLIVSDDDVLINLIFFDKDNHLLYIKDIVSGKSRRTVKFKYIPLNILIKVDFFQTNFKDYPYALFHYTGDKFYNIRIRAHVKKRGMLLNQYGLFTLSGKLIRVHNEYDLTKKIGVRYKSPQDRS